MLKTTGFGRGAVEQAQHLRPQLTRGAAAPPGNRGAGLRRPLDQGAPSVVTPSSHREGRADAD
eukprot:423919-Lingulodinium_polyedra.AAC.1